MPKPKKESKKGLAPSVKEESPTVAVSPTASKDGSEGMSSGWAPRFSSACKLLIAARLVAAIYSNISDCDEVFNYWEPTHYLQYGWGMQTWEYSPVYAIRSWAYVSLHALVGRMIEFILSADKITVFYQTRGVLAVASAFCEAKLYEAVVEHLSPRVGRYLLFILLLNTGMFISATAYLPSTFAMYAITLAVAFSFRNPGRLRTYAVILLTALGAIVGWPFSGAAAIPLIVENLFLSGRPLLRLGRSIEAGFLAILLILFPLVAIDRYFYNKWTIVPFNIVLYNVFSGKDKGPEIYGTEQWWFYLLNGSLNFNIIFPLALASLPAILLRSLAGLRYRSSSQAETHRKTLSLIMKMLPMYLWLAIFTLQPHKEERFLFVVYPLICLNAAIMLHLGRAWLAQLLTSLTKPAKAERISSMLTATLLTIYATLSVSRTFALYFHYHAPLDLYLHVRTFPSAVPPINANTTISQTSDAHQYNLCIGKEWYRFPSHYFLPEGVRLRYLKSDFSGLLPKYFEEQSTAHNGSDTTVIKEHGRKAYAAALRSGRRMTDIEVEGMNDLNQEVFDRYVDLRTCDFLVDYTPLNALKYDSTASEPFYALDNDTWVKHYCMRFLDAGRSSRLARAFYLPGVGKKAWGEYCLLKRKRSVE